MIEFSWINYIKVVSALLVLYYVSIFFFIKKKEKALNGPERSKSKTKDDEYIYSPDNESHVEQIQLDEFLLDNTEEINIPEMDNDTPSEPDESTYISEDSPDFPDMPDMPDMPDLPECSDFNEVQSTFESETLNLSIKDETQTIPADSNFEIEDEYESVDISIDAISPEEDHFIDGAKVEDFKNEFLNDKETFKKEIISFDALMAQNPEIHKTLIEN